MLNGNATTVVGKLLNLANYGVKYVFAPTGSAAASGVQFSNGELTLSGVSLSLREANTLVDYAAAAGLKFSGVTINGSGITLTLGDALNIGSTAFTVTQGTFTTANNNVTCGTFSITGAVARTVNLGSSTITVSTTWNANASTNITFNAGTSQINLSGANIFGGSLTYYNFSFTSTSAGTRTISEGTNTFNNLTLTASATGMSELSLSANQTVNGTFTCAGSSVIARGFVRSNVIGTVRTITAAVISANDCDFRDITIAGAASPISPTRAGDCGGNSGITFPTAKTVYRVGTDTTWAGASSWALASNGTGANNNFPLAQDTVVIDNGTALTGTLSLTTYNIGAFDCSNRTTGITINYGASANFYGSHTLGSGITVSGTSTQTFAGRGTMVFTSAGKTITFAILPDAPSGTFILGDALNSSSAISQTQGTFNTGNYNLTVTTFSSSNSNTRTLTLGSSTITLSGTGNVWLSSTITGLTFSGSSSTIVLSNTTTTARNFQGGGLTFGTLTIGGSTGISTLTFTGSNTFATLSSTKTVAHTISFAANQGTIGTWSITGSVGNVVTVNSDTAGTRRTFTLTNVTTGINYLSVKDIGELNSLKFYVGVNSTNGGNNSNVYFSTPSATANNAFFLMFA
jgi:hypothetical protein